MNTITEAERFALLKVQFAKHGHTLHPSSLNDGGYLATRWGMARPLPTLDAAEAFLTQVGGGRHE